MPIARHSPQAEVRYSNSRDYLRGVHVSSPTVSWLDHRGLRSASALGGTARTRGTVLLRYLLAFLAGIGAAASTALIDLHLRMPGHAILKATLPVALGLAVAPQRFAGLVISGGALTGLVVLRRFFGVGTGMGAMASLLALGPVLDLFLWNVKPGWMLYVRFAAAGLAASCVAFTIRGGGKAAGLDSIRMRPLDDWLTVAPVTYAAFGLAAGLVSSLVLFRTRRGNQVIDQTSP